MTDHRYRGTCCFCGQEAIVTVVRIIRKPRCNKCAYRAHLDRNKAYRLARRPERKPIPCSECGVSFLSTRSDAKYCSDKCRQRAHRRNVTDKQGIAVEHFTSCDKVCVGAAP